MFRSVPQLVSAVALVIGVSLFAVTIIRSGFDETIASASRLGLAFPALLLPGACWHLLRTWGWSIAFPDDARPGFARLFRVRLAADAISFFTIRGVTGEPLKIMLLYDQVAAPVATASITLERLAFAIVSLVIAGVISTIAVRLLAMPGTWDAVFTLLSMVTVIALGILAEIARHRKGDYLGRLVTRLGRLVGRPLETSRVVRFVLDVEDVLLDLLRGDRRRLIVLTVLPVICYLLTAFEVWLVLWVIGEPIGITAALAIDTFARLGSVASAAIPAGIGALEASNAAPVAMLGLGGGGALALMRRVRALLWAGVGLALYPRVKKPSDPH
ncbi:MAG TPA: lysylphosphatidylglycerol synthase transmembrane domain-containing protein [Vicinamibacterales bacterium]|nr:lysylphosphatidylglycerol synthase transmembrane domain-containing protein [Vicinamibacterales bacterium]